MRIYCAKKPKLVCVFVWHLSLLVYLSRSETTCSQIGLVEKYPKPRLRKRRGKKIGLRKKKKKRQRSRLLLVCVVCVCIILLLLSLSISDFFSLSKPESLFLYLLIHGFWFMGSSVWFFMGLIHGFMQSLDFWFMSSWVWFFWFRVVVDFSGFMGLIIC